MENASKALIIAGAILISILIISFGVIILGQGSDVINNANMSDAEIAAFNGKFEAYEGTSVRGSNLKQLAKAVAAHNRSQDSDDKKVVLYKANASTSIANVTAPQANPPTSGGLSIVNLTGDFGGAYNNISVGSFYKVKCLYASTGLITQIIVEFPS